jgi:hypothetical protein
MLTEYQRRFGKFPNKNGDPMGDFPPGLQLIGNKETLSVQCPPYLHIFQAIYVYFLEAQRFH